MLTTQRKALIRGRLKRDGQIIAKELSAELDLSEDTIRRDLRELAAEGLLLRVHGGALPASPGVAPIATRETIAPASKKAIAQRAAGFIRDGHVVILDGGTTTLQLAVALPPELRATFITHSPPIAVALSEHPHAEVILIGGKLFRHSMVAMGAITADMIRHIRADLFFLGVTGIHPDHGLTTGDIEEAAIKRALMNRAAETLVMASEEKLGSVSPFLVGAITDIAGLIVGKAAPEPVLSQIRDAGVSVYRAG